MTFPRPSSNENWGSMGPSSDVSLMTILSAPIAMSVPALCRVGHNDPNVGGARSASHHRHQLLRGVDVAAVGVKEKVHLAALRDAVQELREADSVFRGDLGVDTRDVTDQSALALLDLADHLLPQIPERVAGLPHRALWGVQGGTSKTLLGVFRRRVLRVLGRVHGDHSFSGTHKVRPCRMR